MSDRPDTGAREPLTEAVEAANAQVTQARCMDDTSEWGENYMNIKARHLAALAAGVGVGVGVPLGDHDASCIRAYATRGCTCGKEPSYEEMMRAGVGVPPDKDLGCAPAKERQDARAEVSEMLADLRELADHPLSYGQETHGELHADALAHIERCEEAIRKILEGGEDVRHQGLVEACAIYNERRKEPRKTGWDALSDANKVEWAAMVAEMRDPETKACRCGYPTRECLRVVLRNGPPYPPRPCEAKL